MNYAIGRRYSLTDRGGPGPACDEEGVALGSVHLVRRVETEVGRRYLTIPPDELGSVLQVAYGQQTPEIIERCHQGLVRVASHLEQGEAASAALAAVLLALPNMSAETMAELADVAALRKWGDSWQNQPRVPAGQSGGGQWASDGGGAASSVDIGERPEAHDGSESNRRDRSTKPPTDVPSLPLNDLVFRPSEDHPLRVQTAGNAEEDENRGGIGGNREPSDYTPLQEIFPGLKENPGVAIPMAPIDAFLGISSAADETNLAATTLQYQRLLAQIHSLDPLWRDNELQSLASMSWQARANVINNLRFQWAATNYRVRGDAGPLQVQTLQFLQQAVDDAYETGQELSDDGSLPLRLSQQEAIGNYVDREVRRELREKYNATGISYGPGQGVTINNRDPSTEDQSYKIPDLRIWNVSFDWTLTPKDLSSSQIRGFFRADSSPDVVVIVRPSNFAPRGTYAIARPAYVRKGDLDMVDEPGLYIPSELGEVYDYLGSMLGEAPKFDRGFLGRPGLGIDGTFVALNEGLRRIRSRLGEARYKQLAQLSDRMRACFEAASDRSSDETKQGWSLIHEMSDVLEAVARGD